MAGELCGSHCGHCGRCDRADDVRTPCAECGEPVAGIWCEACMARWNASEDAARHQAAREAEDTQFAATVAALKAVR